VAGRKAVQAAQVLEPLHRFVRGHYYLSRIVLIIGSAIVAAKEALVRSQFSAIDDWIPGVAVLVAILAALDTWLRPGQKWRGFMESRDAVEHLQLNLELGELDYANTLKKLEAIRARHRDRNIF
jgi:uncharacterized membrane protein YcjF (UPF0283 family)